MGTSRDDSPFQPAFWAFLVFSIASIALGEWRPGSLVADFARLGMTAASLIGFGLLFRSGYLRRRPYWTRQSWLLYARLLAIPVAALAFVLMMSTESGMRLMGDPRSMTRSVWAISLVVLMLLGAVGLVVAVDWLRKGDPSAQFTRRSWLPRR